VANGRVSVEDPLVSVAGTYRMDLEALAAQVGPQTRALLLCNPHKPVGRAWSREELEQLSQFCTERGFLVIADEVY
jgi:cystathionine beta-lyase